MPLHLPNGVTATPPTDTSGPRIRILQCRNCMTLDVLPWFEGKPEDDVVLTRVLIDKHNASDPNPDRQHVGVLSDVLESQWNRPDIRDEIKKEMWAKAGGDTSPAFHADRQGYITDAHNCFVAHRRSIPCIDYKNDNKIIPNPAADDRKALGKEMKVDLRNGGPRQHICNYCVVENTVMQKKRDMYGDDYGY